MRVYLDHNATTPVNADVADLVRRCMLEVFANPHSLHGFGVEARRMVEEARQRVASLLGVDEDEIIFTGSGTEADNLAIVGGARLVRKKTGRNKVVTSAIEHPAVLRTVEALKEEGFETVFVPAKPNGVVDIDAFCDALDDKTAVASLMLANNETGVVQPVREVGRRAREVGALMHSDVVQAVGKIEVNLRELDVDLAALSGHKFYAPKGVGALYIRRGVRIEPIVFGGGHERGLRPATLNVPGIAGMGLAAKIAKENLKANIARISQMRDGFEQLVQERIAEIVINGGGAPRLPNTSNISFKFIEGEAVLYDLDRAGIAVSSGSACSSGKAEPSHVLTAMGLEAELARASIRFSFGAANSPEQVEHVVDKLTESVERLRKMSPLWDDAKRRQKQ
ncbi:MAG: cysteine desulfurase NifS [Planctomycetota bacterium]|nr:MAG: cysteine desulfurase NifS [Planctomycetota bacterium]